MNNRTIFVNLRNILASLYLDERSVRRIADDAAINLAQIVLNGHAKNDWHAVLTEATKNNQVEALLTAVECEYRGNEEFRSACAAYRNSQPQNKEPGSEQKPKASEILPPIESIPKLPQFSIAFDWVHVKAGEFVMGQDRAGQTVATDWEIPRTHLFLPEFWITRTAVTVAQFAHFVQATGHKTTAETTGKSYVSTGTRFQWLPKAHWQQPFGPGSNTQQKGDHPVTCVSWYDAIVFCQWVGVHLPSEAEWEKTARGTTASIYPWGNSQPNRGLCNFNAMAGDTLAVGSFPDGASPYGLLNMAGNVWEWTYSLWGREPATPQFQYPYQPEDGRENLQAPAAVLRVVRGGSWDSGAAALRTTFRGRFAPNWPCNHLGFRVVWRPG